MPLDPLNIPLGVFSLEAAEMIADAIADAGAPPGGAAGDIQLNAGDGTFANADEIAPGVTFSMDSNGHLIFISGTSEFAMGTSGIAFLTGATSSNSVAISGAAVIVSALESGASLSLQADSSLSLVCNSGALNLNGAQIGFFGTAAIAKPTVTGAKAGNTALASVIAQLVALGLVTDSTT